MCMFLSVATTQCLICLHVSFIFCQRPVALFYTFCIWLRLAGWLPCLKRASEIDVHASYN